MALKQSPLPDSIYFLTDGGCERSRGYDQLEIMFEILRQFHVEEALPVINTIGLEVGLKNQVHETSEHGIHLIDIAKLGKGEVVFISGANFIQSMAKSGSAKSMPPG